MKFSIIIPVYNRPDELDELLGSLTRQTYGDFETIIVEDGSSFPSESVIRRYADSLTINYITQPNSGPGPARNKGVEAAEGDFVIILDSDCVLPAGYLESCAKAIEIRKPDAFGGPDRASADFSPIQKAISYTMTSFFTTGGIRGGAEKLDHFYPRSFNMGVRREVYLTLGGFSNMRFGEDLDFSYRIVGAGYKSILVPDAWVWHKRRTDFRKFFRQVYNSGIARINLSLRHKGTLKLVHTLPACFTLFVAACLLGCCHQLLHFHILGALGCLMPLVLYSLLIYLDCRRHSENAHTAILAIPAAFIQLCGYGLGFLTAAIRRAFLHKDEYAAFKDSFYK